MMERYPEVCEEAGLTLEQWKDKTNNILKNSHWGGELETRLLALGLGIDILVLTYDQESQTVNVRLFPPQPRPVPKMNSGICQSITLDELYSRWWERCGHTYTFGPLVILHNGKDHYDSVKRV